MNETVEELARALDRWDELGWPRPDLLLVSGSGLAVELGDPGERRRPLADWLPFEPHSVPGHPHEVELLETPSGARVLYQKGRLHSYQGYDAHQTVFFVRLAALLGIHTLVMTNAAGGLDPQLNPGDLALVSDHLNLIGLNPLQGELPPEWGPRFPDMGEAYDRELRELARTVGRRLGLELREGVYAGLAGPSYETPAEVRMLRGTGAQLVGMSTVLEVIAARHMDVRCLCLSLVTNLAAGVGEGPTNHEEVLEAGRAAADKVRRLLRALLEEPALLDRPVGPAAGSG
ncbi:MAG: purine-nucleoside phosphorylase [Thermoanaerobaculia bacterium]